MVSATARSSRRRTPLRAVAIAGLLGAMPGIGMAYGASDAHHSGSCPAAESLVPGTRFAHHRLAKGVTVEDGTATDHTGTVNIHVLRVNLTKPRVTVKPLVGSLADRQPLSTLAAHHHRLVAATNTGYFDFVTGAPTDPLIVNGTPLVISTAAENVVGVGKNDRMEAGQVWSSSTVSVGGSSRPLVATNEVDPPNGISVYTSAWGSAMVPGGERSENRSALRGVVSGRPTSRHHASVPDGGFLLHARGSAATTWLDGLSSGSKVSITPRLRTTAPSRFEQAYGVGVELVAQRGVAQTGFSCDSANTKTPARTAIGWSKGGRELVIALVADHPHTPEHGLDQDEMSKLMAQLGVDQAWSFDGSGSTELLAKYHHASTLSLKTYPADGAERPMPVGLGIEVAKHHKHD